MTQLIIWFNILGFTLVFASAGAVCLIYGAERPKWLKCYLLYIATTAVFTLLNTFSFFNETYLPAIAPLFSRLALYLAALSAVVLLFAVPGFIRTLNEKASGRKWLIPPLFLMVLLIILVPLSSVKPHWHLDRAGTILLNLYLGTYSLSGLLRYRKPRQPPNTMILQVLYLTTALYALVLCQNIVLPSIVSVLVRRQIDVLMGGLICFIWGGTTLARLIRTALRQNRRAGIVLDQSFLTRFGITRRETEIVTQLLQGRSNREIGDSLCISPRTVETHIYNIYRKCSVNSKMELAHLISSRS